MNRFTWTLVAILTVWPNLSEAQCNGTANLTWEAPTLNTDGSLLLDLSQYRIFWGQTLSALNNTNTVNASTTGYTVDGLCTGPWYFAVAAINSTGVSSELSEPATKLIGSGTGGNGSTTPSSPGSSTPVTLGGSVRTLQTTRDAILMPQIATVVANVPCDPRYQIAMNGDAYMLVESSRVTPLSGTVIETAVWAVCQ